MWGDFFLNICFYNFIFFYNLCKTFVPSNTTNKGSLLSSVIEIHVSSTVFFFSSFLLSCFFLFHIYSGPFSSLFIIYGMLFLHFKGLWSIYRMQRSTWDLVVGCSWSYWAGQRVVKWADKKDWWGCFWICKQFQIKNCYQVRYNFVCQFDITSLSFMYVLTPSNACNTLCVEFFSWRKVADLIKKALAPYQH